MGFNIGFVDHVQPIAVAQPVPQRVIGVVRAAHRIEVVLFHQQNVVAHRGFIHHLAVLRMMFMPVGAADQQRLAVQLQQPVADVDLTEANVIGFHLNNFPVWCQQCQRGPVQRWGFSAP
ncbi:hypothetical protein D3C71_1447740 [compost metagenome]